MSGIVDLNTHEATCRAATPGHWEWFGNTKMHEVYLATVDRGRIFVMDFVRWGMRGAQPRFQVGPDGETMGTGFMRTLGELGAAESPLGPKFEVPYRRQFVGIGHPDAAHIAANDPPTVLALIGRIRRLEAALASTIERVEVLTRMATVDTSGMNGMDAWVAGNILHESVIIP